MFPLEKLTILLDLMSRVQILEFQSVLEDGNTNHVYYSLLKGDFDPTVIKASFFQNPTYKDLILSIINKKCKQILENF